MNTKTSADHMADISHKLDVVVGFLATRDMAQDQAIDRLLRMGLSGKVIATVSGITENAVAIRKHRAKGKVAKKGGDKPSPATTPE